MTISSLQYWLRLGSLLLLMMLSPTYGNAQTAQRRIDSLRNEFSQRYGTKSPNDTTAFSLLFHISFELTDIKPDTALIMARQALSIAQNLQDSARIGRAQFVIGYAYKNIGQFILALDAHSLGLKASEAGRDTTYIMRNINGLGLCNLEQKNYPAAQQYFYDILALTKHSKNQNFRRIAHNNLGFILWRLQKFDSALVWHEESYRIAQSLGDTLSIGISLINFGVCYQGKKEFTKALQYFEQALEIHERLGNLRNVMLTRYYIGWTLHDMNRNQEALPWLLQALNLADSINMHPAMPEAYLILSDTYNALGYSKEAIITLKKYTSFKDSLFLSDNVKQASAMRAAYENERKDKEIRLLQEQQERAASERVYYALGFVLLIVFLGILLFLNRQKSAANVEITRQKAILEEQAREIELANTKLHENNLQLQELNSSVKQKVVELEAIDSIVQSINSEVDLEKLLPKLLEQGHVLIPNAEKSSILMFDEEAGTYKFIAFRGYNPDLFSHLRFSPEETRIRYIQTKPVEEGVYVLTEYAVEIENGAKFTNAPPECSLVMTITLDTTSDIELPDSIMFFDNYTSRSAFTSLDIARVQRFRKHVVTAFAKAKIVKIEHDLAKRLAAQNQRLQDLDREKNEFLGIAAHDMKSPLAGIMASAGILKRFSNRMNAEESQKILLGIEHIAKRMSEIITNLLDINAIESGNMNLGQKEINITELIRETLEEQRESASVKNISLLFYDAETPLLVRADAGATVQIIDNLISNAIKYSPKQSRVIVRQIAAKNCVRIAVQDEGPGLSPEDLQKMFGKFARLSAKPTGGEDSTGLGLSIVKRLAEAMQGRAWCESELGNGATFFVELPRVED
ncbi:MAG: tetratricopeptide repeat protein [Candidatus Kapabacteria bacterium]|jgi:signal transduction histidine kinase/Tfp pilus assembly protein PilF|nr:tetratricopeptide repeat protein [Candidatus Kapabacteria bacterium]